MANRSVRSVKNSLKFKAQPKSGIISVRVGVKKLALPVQARMLNGEGYMFLSFPAVSEVFRVDGKSLKPMGPNEDASEAYEKLNPGRRARGRRGTRGGAELPPQLAEALRNVPAGYRLGYAPDGTPKLIKTRQRRAKGRKKAE